MNNRREIRWAPFESIINSNSILQELKETRAKKEKPNLSNDELETLERKIVTACHTRSKITVTYYYAGREYKKEGMISHLSKNDFKIYFVDHTSLYFEQLLDIKFI